MQNGLISVIIPVWKPNLSHLKTCIDSVVAQTYSDIEIIIIYKKSPEFDEDFYRLIKEYQDDKIEVVEDDGGLPIARNVGIIKSLTLLKINGSIAHLLMNICDESSNGSKSVFCII